MSAITLAECDVEEALRAATAAAYSDGNGSPTLNCAVAGVATAWPLQDALQAIRSAEVRGWKPDRCVYRLVVVQTHGALFSFAVPMPGTQRT